MCLPFCFNPLKIIFGLLPLLYLISWPIVIQLFGGDLLRCHSLIFVIYTLCSDISRNLMLKTVGFDIVSRPVALALLVSLFSKEGKSYLSYIQPFYNSLLSRSQSIFLAIEVITFVGIVYKIGNWSGRRFSIFKPRSGSIYFKILNVIIAMLCFLITYLVINEALRLVELGGVPVDFIQAVQVTILLQVISIMFAIYSGKGVLKHSALMAVMACVPIYLEAWSYNYQYRKQMEETTLLNRLSSWLGAFKAWLPVGLGGDSLSSTHRINMAPYHSQYLFSSGSSSMMQSNPNGDTSFNMMINNKEDYDHHSTTFEQHNSQLPTIENLLSSPFKTQQQQQQQQQDDGTTFGLKQLASTIQLLVTGTIKELIQIFWHTFTTCQGCDGLCVRWPWARQSYCLRWAQFYLGTHFWAMLSLRVACLFRWICAQLFISTNNSDANNNNNNNSNNNNNKSPDSDSDQDQEDDHGDEFKMGPTGNQRQARSLLLSSLIPLTRWSIIKILFVLVYTQMLIDHVAISSLGNN